jgi:hypothetical protein
LGTEEDVGLGVEFSGVAGKNEVIIYAMIYLRPTAEASLRPRDFRRMPFGVAEVDKGLHKFVSADSSRRTIIFTSFQTQNDASRVALRAKLRAFAAGRMPNGFD